MGLVIPYSMKRKLTLEKVIPYFMKNKFLLEWVSPYSLRSKYNKGDRSVLILRGVKLNFFFSCGVGEE